MDGVLEAEEKRGRSYLAAVLVNARPNQLVKDPACTAQYLLLGHNTFSWRFVLYPHPALVYNTSTSSLEDPSSLLKASIITINTLRFKKIWFLVPSIIKKKKKKHLFT